MAQLEHPNNLAALPDQTTIALVLVLIETGLRANDARFLAFNPIIENSSGWPCLRYINTKMGAERRVSSARLYSRNGIHSDTEHTAQTDIPTLSRHSPTSLNQRVGQHLTRGVRSFGSSMLLTP